MLIHGGFWKENIPDLMKPIALDLAEVGVAACNEFKRWSEDDDGA